MSSLPKLGGGKNIHLVFFSTSARFNGEYLQNETWYRGRVCRKLWWVPYNDSKLHELWLTNGLQRDRDFYRYPPSVNSAFYFIVKLRTRRSANRTQSKFATCWEVNRICKCMLKFWGVHPQNWGAKHCLFCDGSHLDKTMADDEKSGRSFYPPSVNARHNYGTSGFSG